MSAVFVLLKLSHSLSFLCLFLLFSPLHAWIPQRSAHGKTRALASRSLPWVKNSRSSTSLSATAPARSNSEQTITPYQGDVQKDLGNFAKLLQEQRLSWLSAALDLPAHHATLFLKNHTHVDFPFPAERDLQRLYDAAQPASFGVGNDEVLDASYRSARTLLRDQFAINLRPEAALLQQINALMLGGNIDTDGDEERPLTQQHVRAELYRVNIYGPGDFFKPHKDTPQKDAGHFGSLVVCLPTSFSGGAFVLRSPEGEEVRLDWASSFAQQAQQNETSGKAPVKTQAQAQVVAFASDLDHWIEPVERGFRVTVTFHLYREGAPTKQTSDSFLKRMEQREECRSLRALQASKKLAGKNVVFPLVHHNSARVAKDVVLKGGDAHLFNELEAMGVKPKVMFFVEDHDHDHYDDDDDDDDYGYEWENKSNNEKEEGNENISITTCYLTDEIKYYLDGMYCDYAGADPMEDFAKPYQVIWARNPKTKILSAAVVYGNHPSLGKYRGNLCILTEW